MAMVEEQVAYHTKHLVIASFLGNRLQSFILQIGLHGGGVNFQMDPIRDFYITSFHHQQK
jgi:hypothetical protein